ncbi:hypothetical protein DQ04_02841100 [Trypanosoma grayi]|uniref:hypothetical protein n=1 Tax=Trypanosoma grayi TaxID=71804 RepID=UPI0004F4A6DF|nr:hypothetical protein DQ04_02841100 [Trypanosoma grayi]KEG11228.1 hypothetical protein DQ04_02841100 [Trypanosoma grayi]
MKEFKAFTRYPTRRRQRRNIIRVAVVLAVLFCLYEISGNREEKKPGQPDVIESDNETTAIDAPNASALPKITLYEERTALWGYTGSIDSLIEKRVSPNAFGPAMMRSHEGTLDEWTVTNVTCARLKQLGVTEEEMRRRYTRHRLVKEATGCDTLSVPFNPRRDKRCVEFMTNISNWQELVPIAQSEDQRTIKFGIIFKPLHVTLEKGKTNNDSTIIIQRPVETMVKVPQLPFPSEAVGEVAAFHADRILLTHRVPPTGWACMPLHMIETCVAEYKDRAVTAAVFLRMSGVSNYEEWVKKDLLDYAKHQHLVERNSGGDECIGVSVQLKIADVGHFLSSAMRIPYESHRDTWHVYFNLENMIADKGINFMDEPSFLGVLHLAEINMFDYIIGNMDRSPNKNNFVVGGTRLDLTLDSTFMLHPNQPSFIYLDHGMAFYRRRPRRNPITKSHESLKKSGSDTFCLFRGPLLRRIRDLMQPIGGPKKETVFSLRMKKRLPRRVYSTIGGDGLRYCSMRGRELLAMAERCLTNERIRPYVLFP